MSLVEQCEELQVSLAQLDAVRRGASDGAAVDERYQQWQTSLKGLNEMRERASWLQIDENQVPEYSAKLAHAVDLASQAARSLEESADIDLLTHEDLWTRLLKTCVSASDLLSAQISQRWSEEVADFCALTPSHQLEASASPLPQNAEPLLRYRENYSTAARLANLNAPRTSADCDLVRTAVQQCKDYASKVKFDAPQDVADFFRAVNAGGASMALVTPSVLQWLSENAQLEKYIVRGVSK